jgi:hypothetical protein
MNLREMLALGPIAVACLWIGLYPTPLLDMIHRDVASVTSLYQRPDNSPLPIAGALPGSEEAAAPSAKPDRVDRPARAGVAAVEVQRAAAARLAQNSDVRTLTTTTHAD